MIEYPLDLSSQQEQEEKEQQIQREQQIVRLLTRIANSLEGIEGVLKRSNL